MGLFKAVVGTLVETVKLPVAVVHDAVTLCGTTDNNGKSHTLEALDRIKEASDDS